MTIHLSPKEIFRINLYVILFLLGAAVFEIITRFYFEDYYVAGFLRLFKFDAEKNIPTFYSSIAILFAGILLSLIYSKRKEEKLPYRSWLFLSIIFIFLSIDEISSIHERLIIPLRHLFRTSDFLYFAWVIPYGLALLVFVIAYSRFWYKLPGNIRGLFLLSGTIYVSGALGFELIGGKYADTYGTDNIIYAIITTCEELLEMLGIAVFIYTLFTYIVREFDSLEINVGKKTN